MYIRRHLPTNCYLVTQMLLNIDLPLYHCVSWLHTYLHYLDIMMYLHFYKKLHGEEKVSDKYYITCVCMGLHRLIRVMIRPFTEDLITKKSYISMKWLNKTLNDPYMTPHTKFNFKMVWHQFCMDTFNI